MWSVMRQIFSAMVLEKCVFCFNDQAERGDDRADTKSPKSEKLKLASP
jgi:hypothetical protein